MLRRIFDNLILHLASSTLKMMRPNNRIFTKTHAMFLGLFVVNVIFLLPWRHPCEYFGFVTSERITSDLVKNVAGFPSCQLIPKTQFDPPFRGFPSEVSNESLESLAEKFGVKPGGRWRPFSCSPQFDVAVVVPYRDRSSQLAVFLLYMHHFLIHQNIDFTIYIVEQTFTKPFNRGKLFNVGFKEAMKLDNHSCFIFHDVDLLPEKSQNVYACSQQPRHMVSALNTFRYNLPYCDLFGGAVAFTKDQYVKVNGFANRFFGWGGEDDDFSERVMEAGYNITRWDPAIARYSMLPHAKEAANENRYLLLQEGKQFRRSDGLSNLEYVRLKIERRRLYTWILAEI